MPKHLLTISPDYVQDWGIKEAVRELFQNALDNETINPENEMYFNYDAETQTLQIGNKTSKLELETLLIGFSSKREDSKTIGQHGEGYKIALMVLLRSNKNVTIYNYGKREIWTTRLVKSRTYNGALIPEINIQKKALFSKVPSHDLMIEVTNVTEEDYEEIKKYNLHLQSDYDKISIKNSASEILTSEEHKGMIFVNGLYINTTDRIRYGYNFAPDVIRLDRDRKLVDTFNLQWRTSELWGKAEQQDLVAQMLIDGVRDVEYLSNTSYMSSGTGMYNQELVEETADLFIEKHGTQAIPVSSQEELQAAQTIKGYTPVMVSESAKETLARSSKLSQPIIPKLTVKEQLEELAEELMGKLSTDEFMKLMNLINKVEN